MSARDALLLFVMVPPIIIFAGMMIATCAFDRSMRNQDTKRTHGKTPREQELERQYKELEAVVVAQMEDNAAAMEAYRRLNEEAAKAAAVGKNRT